VTITQIKALVNPTESPEKVADSLKKIFGDIDLKSNETEIHSQLIGLQALSTFRSRIASDKIRTTLNRLFNRWVNENRLTFGLNRQAAHAGHVSINLENEDPMGPIQIVIEGDLAEVITYLTS
jgi:predicted RNA binding protein with dsRBD fold (UPF0201 family)